MLDQLKRWLIEDAILFFHMSYILDVRPCMWACVCVHACMKELMYIRNNIVILQACWRRNISCWEVLLRLVMTRICEAMLDKLCHNESQGSLMLTVIVISVIHDAKHVVGYQPLKILRLLTTHSFILWAMYCQNSTTKSSQYFTISTNPNTKPNERELALPPIHKPCKVSTTSHKDIIHKRPCNSVPIHINAHKMPCNSVLIHIMHKHCEVLKLQINHA